MKSRLAKFKLFLLLVASYCFFNYTDIGRRLTYVQTSLDNIQTQNRSKDDPPRTITNFIVRIHQLTGGYVEFEKTPMDLLAKITDCDLDYVEIWSKDGGGASEKITLLVKDGNEGKVNKSIRIFRSPTNTSQNMLLLDGWQGHEYEAFQKGTLMHSGKINNDDDVKALLDCEIDQYKIYSVNRCGKRLLEINYEISKEYLCSRKAPVVSNLLYSGLLPAIALVMVISIVIYRVDPFRHFEEPPAAVVNRMPVNRPSYRRHLPNPRLAGQVAVDCRLPL